MTSEALGSGENPPDGTRIISPQSSDTYRVNPDSEPWTRSAQIMLCSGAELQIGGTSRFLNSRRNNHRLNAACSVVVAIDRYQTCSMRKSGSPDSHISGNA